MPAIAIPRALAPAGKGAAADPALGLLPVWKLSDLYEDKDSPAFRADLDKAAKLAREFEAKWKGKLAEAAGKTGSGGIGEALAEYEVIEDIFGKIGSFAGLTYFSDTSNPANGKFYGDVQSKLTDLSAHLLFLPLELNRIDDAVMDACMDRDPAAGHYRPWIVDLRKDKPYQLEDKLEQLFLEKSMTSSAAFNRLFDETMAELRYDIDGEKVPLEVALNMLQEPDEPTRAKAAAALSKTFKDNIRIFTLVTNTLAKDKDISDRWRGFEDIADSRHLGNRVEREVVDALAEAVKAAYPRLSHRYYAMKAKWLGMEEMNFWDRNAPLPETSNALISWEEAKNTVLSAYGGFAPEMADIARRFFDEEWIDAPVRTGKAPGAFAHPTVPSAHPYVLVNYMGKPRDVMTLAHELGHGVHQVLAGKQGALMCQTPLTLAETASVFGEMLTFRALLEKTKDKRERKAMLAQKVEDMINTVVRQIAFYEFERKVHTARKEGELTSEQIGELWLSVQAESLGPAIRISEGYETWWAYIPHFIHSPFYVYAYAFGDCLVNSLYAVYQGAEPGFQQKYFELLKAGGTKHHSELLKPFGLDATDPSFWSKGLSMIEGLIDELEALDKGNRL
ncbi:M3 family oligoendopeptidase [Rhizobium sp. LC145]|uniref:M3 family oligoendopeptidase n=1 Tax=Rhizobium sp. LC145 TaxID=1120688 RepID=UPI000629F66E|nr:M3 family oligoendopeptidase [Rhizobium sp. LC145]KKX30884.1 oligoendopeptidase F [Rhizobium sp. LC145]TKT46485.1 M3 family oligoendopeptidase [Rhizobiaceae bacterium LC148]